MKHDVKIKTKASQLREAFFREYLEACVNNSGDQNFLAMHVIIFLVREVLHKRMNQKIGSL